MQVQDIWIVCVWIITIRWSENEQVDMTIDTVNSFSLKLRKFWDLSLVIYVQEALHRSQIIVLS